MKVRHYYSPEIIIEYKTDISVLIMRNSSGFFATQNFTSAPIAYKACPPDFPDIEVELTPHILHVRFRIKVILAETRIIYSDSVVDIPQIQILF